MKFDTKTLHGGHNPEDSKNCIPVPIYMTTAFNFNDVQYAADLFDLKVGGDIYTRISNPTTAVLEERMAALEKGVGGLAVSSGQAASTLAIMNIAKAGDEIVAAAQLYGGTVNLFGHTLKKFGINVNMLADENPEAYRKAITPKTKAIFIEALSNPKLNVPDIEAIAKIAHENNIPLIVDNTIPTPYLLTPIDFGADIIVHSITKYINGHGNSMGGVIVDCGTFDWEKSGKFPELSAPDPSYHGVSYTKTFGKAAFIVKARVQLLRDLGTCISPMNSYLTLLGLETLHLRVQRMSETALKVAKFLENHEKVTYVNYPKLESSVYFELGKKYLPKGGSSLIGFRVKGGREGGTRFVENLKLLIHATNLGDSRSIITYSALTTHRQLSDEQLEACGVYNDFMRLSVGLEDADDIIADIDYALSKV